MQDYTDCELTGFQPQLCNKRQS